MAGSVVTEQPRALTVVARDTLLSCGVRCFLSASRYAIGYECPSLGHALALATSPVELVFVAVPLDRPNLELLRKLRAAFQGSRIVLYAQMIGVPESALVDLFGTCLDGYLPPETSLEILRHSLELISLGQHIFPFSQLFASRPEPQRGGRAGNLSKREEEVLQFLRGGKTNKVIAGELHLSEATVKAHVRGLMRKLGVRSRIEAALWAHNAESWQVPSPPKG